MPHAESKQKVNPKNSRNFVTQFPTVPAAIAHYLLRARCEQPTMANLRGLVNRGCLRYSLVLLGIVVLYLLWTIGKGPTWTSDIDCKCPSGDGDKMSNSSSHEAPLACPPSGLPGSHPIGSLQPYAQVPVEDWRYGTDEIVGQLSHSDRIDYPVPKVREVIAESCLKKLNKSTGEKSFHLYRETKIRIVYGIWLPAGQPHSHLIAEPQLYEIFATGLFTRPNTYVHVIVSTNSSTELNWLKSLDLWQHIPNHEFIHNYWNMYEYPAMRAMWEMSCKDPDAVYLYFHNKGTRYRHSQRFSQELILTRQIILPWKSMLTILMSQPEVPHIGFGGIGWQWMNFFWIKGSYLRDCPIPIRTNDRFYYEYYIARRAPTNQCHLAKGFSASLRELPVPTPRQPANNRSFSIDACATGSITAGQILRTVFDHAKRPTQLTQP